MNHKRIMAGVIASLFFTSACATTQYVPKQSWMIKIMPKGYQKDDQFFKGAKGLVKAVESDEEALHYAQKARKNKNWASGLLWSGLAMYVAGASTGTDSQSSSSSRNVTAFSLLGAGFVAIVSSVFPAIAANANRTDAINKYNDDVLLKTAPQIFNAPAPATKPEKKKSEAELKNNPEASVITVQQKRGVENE